MQSRQVLHPISIFRGITFAKNKHPNDLLNGFTVYAESGFLDNVSSKAQGDLWLVSNTDGLPARLKPIFI